MVTASTNFPCVDAFDSPTCAYQITLNSNHKLKAKEWKKFLDACAEARGEEDTVVDLYILLPSRIYQQGIKPMAFSGEDAIINAPLLKPRYKEWMLCLDDELLKTNAVEVILEKITV